MTHSITSVTTDNVPPLTYDGKPVVTTAVLANLYGTEESRIRKNHNRNKTRFESGKHFYKVDGKELSDLRVSLGHSQIPAKARAAILWTERGAARHAKMLETDQAWDVFEALEDNYFGPRQKAADQHKALPSSLTPAHQRGIQKAVARRCQALPEPARRSAYSRIYSHLKDRFEVGTYKDIDDSRYTEALGAVQSFELEGEWIDGKAPVEALIIDAPRAKHWAEYTVGELIGESTAHGQISQALNTLRRAARSGVHVNVRDMEAIDHEVAALRHIAEQALNRVDAITANLDCVQRHADIAERTWTGSIGPAVAMFDQVLAANMREHLGVLSRLLRYEIQRPRLAFAS